MRRALLVWLLAGCASIANGEVVASNKWKKILVEDLVKVACMPDGYFDQCFETSEAACGKAVRDSFANCAATTRLPATVNTSSNGADFASKLGQCTGAAVERKISKKKPLPEDCLDMRNWL